MSALRNARMLARYTAWANERLFATLTAAAGTMPAPLLQRIVGILNHAAVVDHIWKGHLEAEPHGFTARNTEVKPPLEALRELQASLDAWYVHYADALSARAHDEVVDFTFVDGGAGALARGDMLLHVVNHKTYHRGYVAEMLYAAGLKPPTMDLPVFLRDAYAGA